MHRTRPSKRYLRRTWRYDCGNCLTILEHAKKNHHQSTPKALSHRREPWHCFFLFFICFFIYVLSAFLSMFYLLAYWCFICLFIDFLSASSCMLRPGERYACSSRMGRLLSHGSFLGYRWWGFWLSHVWANIAYGMGPAGRIWDGKMNSLNTLYVLWAPDLDLQASSFAHSILGDTFRDMCFCAR